MAGKGMRQVHGPHFTWKHATIGVNANGLAAGFDVLIIALIALATSSGDH